MIALAALVVAEVAAIPPAVSNAIHFLFTVAAALQGAIWLRDLVLGWVEHRAAAGGDEEGFLAFALGHISLYRRIGGAGERGQVVVELGGGGVRQKQQKKKT